MELLTFPGAQMEFISSPADQKDQPKSLSGMSRFGQCIVAAFSLDLCRFLLFDGSVVYQRLV